MSKITIFIYSLNSNSISSFAVSVKISKACLAISIRLQFRFPENSTTQVRTAAALT